MWYHSYDTTFIPNPTDLELLIITIGIGLKDHGSPAEVCGDRVRAFRRRILLTGFDRERPIPRQRDLQLVFAVILGTGGEGIIDEKVDLVGVDLRHIPNISLGDRTGGLERASTGTRSCT